jgi:hypothetical protein
MNHDSHHQGVVWGGYPINLSLPENLVSRKIKSIINRCRVNYFSSKTIQRSFLRTSSQYSKGVSLDGLWSTHAKGFYGKISEKNRLIEALSFLRLFLKRERSIVLTDEQYLTAWFLSQQFFINDYQSVNKIYSLFLAACINVWQGRKVHLVMANELIASNDYEKLKECYRKLGIKAAIIDSQMDFKSRQEAYEAQVVYVSAQQLMRDALVDFESLNAVGVGPHYFLDKLSSESIYSKLLLSGLDTVIINDADFILLELAVQPVLLEQEQQINEVYSVLKVAMKIAGKMIIEEDYTINQSLKTYWLTDEGQNKCKFLSEDDSSFWSGKQRRENIVSAALIVLNEYTVNSEYVLENNHLQIIKENTYTTGLGITQQNLELLLDIKEGLPEAKKRIVQSQISCQRFFSYYFKVSGFTYGGEAVNEEISRSYHYPCYTVKDNRQLNENRLRTYLCKNLAEKTDKLKQLFEPLSNITKGQIIILRSKPILDGVLSAMASINREIEILEFTNKDTSLEHSCLSILESNKVLIITGFVEFSNGLSENLHNLDVYILEGYENFQVRRFWQRSSANIAMISAYDDPLILALIRPYLFNFYFRLKGIYFLEKLVNQLYFYNVNKRYEKFKSKQRQKVRNSDSQYKKFYAFVKPEKFQQ